MAKRCYYEALSVERTATETDIKAAFRKQAMACHPDRHPGDKQSEHRFKEINEAYEVLKDPDKRAAYDRFGHAAFEHGMGGGPAGFSADFGTTFSDLFEGIFGMSGGGGRGRGAGRERRAERADPHSDLGHLRGLLRLRRQGRHHAENLPDVRRSGTRPPCARIFHDRAHLPELRRPRPVDRQPLRVMLGVRPGHARADAVGEYPGGR
jgi:curved DNA-binding protein CbpA